MLYWCPVAHSTILMLMCSTYANRRTMLTSRCQRMRRCRSRPWHRSMTTRMMIDFKGRKPRATCIQLPKRAHVDQSLMDVHVARGSQHVIDAVQYSTTIYMTAGSMRNAMPSLHKLLTQTSTCMLIYHTVDKTARYGRYTWMACVRERHSGQRSIRCAHSQQVHMWPHAANTAAAGSSRQMAQRFSFLQQRNLWVLPTCKPADKAG
jgi:hypothetical protein